MPELKIRIGGDTSGFAAAADRARSIGGRLALNLQSTLAGKIGNAFAGGVSLAASKQLVDYAGHINDISEAAGVSTTRMQEMGFAADQAGATVDDMARAAKTLAEARAEALENPGGDKAKAFAKIRIDSSQLARLSDAGDLMYAVSDAVKQLNLDANSTPIILSLIGSRGSVVLPALKAGLREAGAEAQAAGTIISSDTITALDKLGDRFGVIGGQIKSFGAEIVRWAGHLVDGVITGIEAMVPYAQKGLGQVQKALGFTEAGQANIDAGEQGRKELRQAFLDRFNPEVKAKTGSTDIGNPEAKQGDAIKEAERLAAVYREIEELNKRIARARMTDAEVTADMRAELERERKMLREMDGNPVARAEQEKRVKTLEAEIIERDVRGEKEKKKPEEIHNSKFKSDSAISVGAMIGGYASGGIVNDVLGQRQLSAQQATANHTRDMLNVLRNWKPTNNEEGWV